MMRQLLHNSTIVEIVEASCGTRCGRQRVDHLGEELLRRSVLPDEDKRVVCHHVGIG